MHAVLQIMKQMDRRARLLHSQHSDSVRSSSFRSLDKGGDSAWSRFARWRRVKLATFKSDYKELVQGLRLTAPKEVQARLKQHDAIRDQFQGKCCGCNTSLMRRLQRLMYSIFQVQEGGGIKTRVPYRALHRLKFTTSVLTYSVLLFLTFFCFLYAVSLDDNTVTVGILWSVLLALAVEVMITGPMTIMMTYALMPYLAARLVEPDVKHVFETDARVSLARVSTNFFDEKLNTDLDDDDRVTQIAEEARLPEDLMDAEKLKKRRRTSFLAFRADFRGRASARVSRASKDVRDVSGSRMSRVLARAAKNKSARDMFAQEKAHPRQSEVEKAVADRGDDASAGPTSTL